MDKQEKPTMVPSVEPLSQGALADLAASGLDAADARKLGITALATLYGLVDNYRLPYFDPDGKPLNFYRDKLIPPRETKDGLQRYDQPKGKPPRYYFARNCATWPRIVKDHAIRIVFTEGEKKAACGCKHGFPVIGLGGVDCWKTVDLGKIVWRGRDVLIAFDSDLHNNANVRRAQWLFAKELRQRGAQVRVVNLPSRDDGGKQGLDDFLVGHGAKALEDLIDAATAPKPVIEMLTGHAMASLEEIVDALAASGTVYNRGGSLVRVIDVREARALGIKLPGDKDDDERSIRRDESQPTIVTVSADYLRVLLHEIADLIRFDMRSLKFVAVDCPKDFALSVLALGNWKGVHPLRTIARAPFLRNDGSMCDAPGYDSATATLLVPNIDSISVPQTPTKAEALEALAQLRAPFDEVTWAEPKHESVFLAYMLTLAVRPILGTVTAFIFNAPQPRTGKTLLADCGALIVHGTLPAKRSYPMEEDERRKVLHSSALAGDPVLLFDNVQRGLAVGGEALNMYLTAEVTADRTLGESSTPRLPNACTVVITGNNIGATADFVSRTVAITLDANCEHPEQRQFRIPDLQEYVKVHRAELLRALLTILRAFVVARAPRPPGRPALGGFAAWDRLVAGCVCWLGLDDPVGTQEDLHEDDEDAVAASTVFELLFKTFPQEFEVKDVKEASGELALQIMAVCGDDLKTLPYWLRQHRNQVHGNLKLIVTKDKPTHRKWKVRKLGKNK